MEQFEPWIKRYEPPPLGSADHADPYFKKRVRKCGRPGCDREFQTTPRWRYFCEKCRKSHDVLKGLGVTYGLRRVGTAKSNTT